MYQKIASISQCFYIPTICTLCNHPHRDHDAICKSCAQLLKPITHPCQICCRPLPSHDFLLCGLCLKNKPHFDRVITHYLFEEPLRSLLHALKYENALYLRRFLAQLMLDAYDENIAQADCLIPIPLHPERMRQRGFNQAAELAKIIARKIHSPYNTKLCRKITNPLPQVGLNGKARETNLRHSFEVKKSTYQHVILIDDIITTGSTANEVARTLKHQGVMRVDVWCCARATLM